MLNKKMVSLVCALSLFTIPWAQSQILNTIVKGAYYTYTGINFLSPITTLVNTGYSVVTEKKVENIERWTRSSSKALKNLDNQANTILSNQYTIMQNNAIMARSLNQIGDNLVTINNNMEENFRLVDNKMDQQHSEVLSAIKQLDEKVSENYAFNIRAERNRMVERTVDQFKYELNRGPQGVSSLIKTQIEHINSIDDPQEAGLRLKTMHSLMTRSLNVLSMEDLKTPGLEFSQIDTLNMVDDFYKQLSSVNNNVNQSTEFTEMKKSMELSLSEAKTAFLENRNNHFAQEQTRLQKEKTLDVKAMDTSAELLANDKMKSERPQLEKYLEISKQPLSVTMLHDLELLEKEMLDQGKDGIGGKNFKNLQSLIKFQREKRLAELQNNIGLNEVEIAKLQKESERTRDFIEKELYCQKVLENIVNELSPDFLNAMQELSLNKLAWSYFDATGIQTQYSEDMEAVIRKLTKEKFSSDQEKYQAELKKIDELFANRNISKDQKLYNSLHVITQYQKEKHKTPSPYTFTEQDIKFLSLLNAGPTKLDSTTGLVKAVEGEIIGKKDYQLKKKEDLQGNIEKTLETLRNIENEFRQALAESSCAPHFTEQFASCLSSNVENLANLGEILLLKDNVFDIFAVSPVVLKNPEINLNRVVKPYSIKDVTNLTSKYMNMSPQQLLSELKTKGVGRCTINKEGNYYAFRINGEGAESEKYSEVDWHYANGKWNDYPHLQKDYYFSPDELAGESLTININGAEEPTWQGDGLKNLISEGHCIRPGDTPVQYEQNRNYVDKISYYMNMTPQQFLSELKTNGIGRCSMNKEGKYYVFRVDGQAVNRDNCREVDWHYSNGKWSSEYPQKDNSFSPEELTGESLTYNINGGNDSTWALDGLKNMITHEDCFKKKEQKQ